MNRTCEDLQLLGNYKIPENPQCAECVKTGASWVHLRTCQSCGITLCCDSSPNKHMTSHYKATLHPAVVSAEPGEKWIYCYKHDVITHYR